MTVKMWICQTEFSQTCISNDLKKVGSKNHDLIWINNDVYIYIIGLRGSFGLFGVSICERGAQWNLYNMV